MKLTLLIKSEWKSSKRGVEKLKKRGVKNPLAYLLSYAHAGATMTKEISEEKKNIFPLFLVGSLGHI